MSVWIRLSLRNLGRNTRRSVLTACSVLVGTLMITLTSSWLTGIFGGMMDLFTASSGHIRLVTEDFYERQALHPLYENIPDAEAVIADLKTVPGVKSAIPRITAGVVITVDDEIGDDFAMLNGATADYYANHLRAEDYLLAGEWLSGNDGEVVLGRRIARQIDAGIGDQALLLGQTQDGAMSPLSARVVGIIGGDAMMEMQAFTSLNDMRWLTDIDNGALDILVYTRSRRHRDVEPVLQRIRSHNTPEISGLIAIPWYEDDTFAGIITLVSGLRNFIAFLMILVTALAIFNTMTMSVMERTQEIGVLRAMGKTRAGVIGTFLFEASIIGLIGGIAGTGIGSIGAFYLKLHGVTLSSDLVDKVGSGMPIQTTMYGELNWEIVIGALLTGLLMALLGVLVPAFRAGRVSPVEAMKSRH